MVVPGRRRLRSRAINHDVRDVGEVHTHLSTVSILIYMIVLSREHGKPLHENRKQTSLAALGRPLIPIPQSYPGYLDIYIPRHNISKAVAIHQFLFQVELRSTYSLNPPFIESFFFFLGTTQNLSSTQQLLTSECALLGLLAYFFSLLNLNSDYLCFCLVSSRFVSGTITKLAQRIPCPPHTGTSLCRNKSKIEYSTIPPNSNDRATMLLDTTNRVQHVQLLKFR